MHFGMSATHTVYGSMGCKLYKAIFRNLKLVIVGAIITVSGLAALFDLTSCLAFIETRFNTIHQCILYVRQNI